MNRCHIKSFLAILLLSLQQGLNCSQDGLSIWQWLRSETIKQVAIYRDVTIKPKELTSCVSKAQTVVILGSEEVGKKEITCWRLYAKTIVLLYVQMCDGAQALYANSHCKCNHSMQLNEVLTFVNDQKNVSRMQAVVLAANDDPANSISDYPLFWNNYKKFLKKMDIHTEMLYYKMIPGDSHRGRDHFVAHLNVRGVTWSSAIDDFQKHTMFRR